MVGRRVEMRPAPGVAAALRLLADYLGIDPGVIVAVVTPARPVGYVAKIYAVHRPFVVNNVCPPAHAVEVVEDTLSMDDRRLVETLVHELLHIPKTWKGYLRPHGRWVYEVPRIVEKMPPELVRRAAALARGEAKPDDVPPPGLLKWMKACQRG